MFSYKHTTYKHTAVIYDVIKIKLNSLEIKKKSTYNPFNAFSVKCSTNYLMVQLRLFI